MAYSIFCIICLAYNFIIFLLCYGTGAVTKVCDFVPSICDESLETRAFNSIIIRAYALETKQ